MLRKQAVISVHSRVGRRVGDTELSTRRSTTPCSAAGTPWVGHFKDINILLTLIFGCRAFLVAELGEWPSACNCTGWGQRRVESFKVKGLHPTVHLIGSHRYDAKTSVFEGSG